MVDPENDVGGGTDAMQVLTHPVKRVTETLRAPVLEILPGNGACTVSPGPAEKVLLSKTLLFDVTATA